MYICIFDTIYDTHQQKIRLQVSTVQGSTPRGMGLVMDVSCESPHGMSLVCVL